MLDQVSFDPQAVGRLLSLDKPLVRDFGGTTLELLSEFENADGAPALMRGTMPGGALVPLHAHPDPETFYVVAGRLEGLVIRDSEAEWLSVATGQIFHVSPNARHALRNTGEERAVALTVSTPRLAEFFARTGIALPSAQAPRRPMTSAELAAFIAEAQARGHWNASPEENAEFGIDMARPGQA